MGQCLSAKDPIQTLSSSLALLRPLDDDTTAVSSAEDEFACSMKRCVWEAALADTGFRNQLTRLHQQAFGAF